MGWITLGHDDYCRPLLNTNPVYDSKEQATKNMEDLVSLIKDTNFDKNVDQGFIDKCYELLLIEEDEKDDSVFRFLILTEM